ncbi:MAG: hypothetical protein JWR30_3730 [Conexibacter sp.]|nr:hypothetical protein [Conexibacter sp.]
MMGLLRNAHRQAGLGAVAVRNVLGIARCVPGSAGQAGVELEKVVAGGDELPFRLAGGQAAALESRDSAQELDAGETRSR